MQLPVNEIGWIGLGLLAIIAGAFGFGSKALIKYANENIKNGAYDLLKKWVYSYVAALMQDPTLKGLASEQKKQRAVIWVMAQAEKLNIPLDLASASVLIEEAVYILKKTIEVIDLEAILTADEPVG